MKVTTLQVLMVAVLPALVGALETIPVLVILTQWKNHFDRTLIPRGEIGQLWNGPSNTSVVPGESVSDYILSNSYGKYNVSAEVTNWLQVNLSEKEAANGPIEDLMAQVIEEVAAYGVSLDAYANDDNQLEGVVFVHSGYRAEFGGMDCETGAVEADRVASQSWTGEKAIANATYTLKSFSTVSAYEGICNLRIARIGVHAREWLQSKFGLEELNDTGGRYNDSPFSTGGLGGFGLMSSPAGQRNSEAFPGILSPYSKLKMGVLDPILITEDGTYTANASALVPDVYMISKKYESGEYLLIENRQALLSDSYMWESEGGIVIYHVDENTEGYGNYVRGGPFVEGWPGNGAHYKVAVLQADGKYELEQAINVGGVEDFWKSGDVLGRGNGESVASSEGTYPNTDSYVGGNIKITGITIDEFKEVEAGVWSFRVKGLDDTPAPTGTPTSAPSSAPIVPPDGASSIGVQVAMGIISSAFLVATALW